MLKFIIPSGQAQRQHDQDCPPGKLIPILSAILTHLHRFALQHLQLLKLMLMLSMVLMDMVDMVALDTVPTPMD